MHLNYCEGNINVNKLKIFFVNYGLAIFIIIFGLYFQLICHEKNCLNFSRAGSLLVVLGLVLEGKYVLRVTDVYTHIRSDVLSISGDDPRASKDFGDYMRKFHEHIGFIWIIIGTLIWGFGDLV